MTVVFTYRRVHLQCFFFPTSVLWCRQMSQCLQSVTPENSKTHALLLSWHRKRTFHHQKKINTSASLSVIIIFIIIIMVIIHSKQQQQNPHKLRVVTLQRVAFDSQRDSCK